MAGVHDPGFLNGMGAKNSVHTVLHMTTSTQVHDSPLRQGSRARFKVPGRQNRVLNAFSFYN